ncbi:PucR family transcriptional regulator [Nocardia harenae]|uniref:PucR family transcriptional regulator n=1 Tax=Nocardia harenae TaxID=358707 RepID=UPI00082D8193|nr:helix-turn-helix domain-containing protein [Nocardia harenae]
MTALRITDNRTLARTCAECARALLDGHDEPGAIARLELLAVHGARDELPLDTIQHAVHASMTAALDRAADRSEPELAARLRRVVEVLDLMVTTVATGYLRELRILIAERRHAVRALTAALLAGTLDAAPPGLPIAPRYLVLALAADLDDDGEPGQRPHRVRAVLTGRCGEDVLALLDDTGGIVLLPADRHGRSELRALVGELAEAAGVTLLATVESAPVPRIPAAAQRVRRLLGTLTALRYPSGLYLFEDMALEYQLTLPGPARDRLAAVLRPLEEQPDLLTTLRAHLRNELRRRRTARELRIHPNTLDLRIKRITRLTGYDLTTVDGAWTLRSALIAHAHHAVAG